MQELVNRLINAFNATLPAPTLPSTIPTSSPEVKDLIAYRCWRIHPTGFLQSTYMDTIWFPQQTMEANSKSLELSPEYGIFSLKTLELALTEYSNAYCPYAYGTVQIFGTVIEHDHGYRSQYARVVSIDHISQFLCPTGRRWKVNRYSEKLLKSLQDQYNLNET